MANKKENGALDVNETLSKSEAFFLKYKKAIIISVVVLVVVIAGAFAYNSYVAVPRAEKASTALSQGQEYFDMEQYDKALNGDSTGYVGFVKIASDYSGTDAANLANLYAGLCYANLGKWEEAVKFLDSYSPSGDAMVSPAAVGALGNAYAQTGNVDKAISTLKKAASMADSKALDGVNVSVSPTFFLQAGVLLESQNKKAEALELYKDIKKKYVNSHLVQSGEIEKYIARVSE